MGRFGEVLRRMGSQLDLDNGIIALSPRQFCAIVVGTWRRLCHLSSVLVDLLAGYLPCRALVGMLAALNAAFVGQWRPGEGGRRADN